ncbi:hypothetical protein KGF57_000039 [Candida theae]|uniref:Uncharacterized protein n=1 Tax=Candida theae TaxID=1198502 RepID=A0AAD5G106_9ASCO|nr:uncharacterized protein KGF57_000039 [Candida theae]KAI5968924.1 hypothetical protein KGF57_000039 [Candida theae]
MQSLKPFSVSENPAFKLSPHRIHQLLEAIVFHMLCVIECLKQKKEVPQIHLEYFSSIIAQLGHIKDRSFDCQSIQCKFAIPHNDALQSGLQCFCLVTQHIKEPYTEDDLISWIKSCSSKSVTSSLSLVTENTPAFVLFDILLRSPKFKEQFLVQSELWTHNIYYLMTQMKKDPYIIKAMLDNLTYYAVMFESRSLLSIYQTTLDFLNLSRTHINLGDAFIDDIIWNLAVYSLRYQKIDPLSIANAQELLMSQIRNKHGRSLTLKGYLGIALVMSRISYSKGISIFRIAEKIFMEKTHSKKDSLVYYLTKIHLSRSASEAVDSFKTASNQFDYSSTLWLFFIRKLKYLKLMDEKRVKMLFKQIYSSKVKVTVDIVFEFLHFAKDFTFLEELFCSVSNSKQTIVQSTFRVKYIQLLQRRKVQEESIPELPWEKCDEEHQNRNFDSIEQCITHIYNTSPVKSMQLIVAFLSYISNHDTVKFFEIYQQEVLDKDHLPSAACLKLLLDTAKESENVRVTDKLVVSQLAIREFQKNVQANTKAMGIFPRDDLWKSYISLLAKFGYISELSKIIKWWIDLNFKPKKATILCLLDTLPEEFALRHIKHHQAAKSKKDWDWPTTREFKKHKWIQGLQTVSK